MNKNNVPPERKSVKSTKANKREQAFMHCLNAFTQFMNITEYNEEKESCLRTLITSLYELQQTYCTKHEEPNKLCLDCLREMLIKNAHQEIKRYTLQKANAETTVEKVRESLKKDS